MICYGQFSAHSSGYSLSLVPGHFARLNGNDEELVAFVAKFECLSL